MTITKTNNREVLFEELCEEAIASITGGGSVTSTVSVQVNNSTTPEVPKDLTGNEIIANVNGKPLTLNTGSDYTVNLKKDSLSVMLNVSSSV